MKAARRTVEAFSSRPGDLAKITDGKGYAKVKIFNVDEQPYTRGCYLEF